MTERGVFAVDRGIWDHHLLADGEPFSRREAWLWLISEAAWKPHRRRIGGASVSLERGQFAASIRFLADKWLWHRSKVERFLAQLKTEAMIETSSETGLTVITICKYDEYQRVSLPDETSSVTPSETAARQQRDKVEDKEDKEESSEPKKALRLRAHPLPDDFTLTEADRQVARPEGWTEAKIDSEFQRFRDHAAANGRKQVDWRAAWRNWVRSPFQNAPRAGPTNGHGAAAPRPGSREDTRERTVNALRKLDLFVNAGANDAGAGGGDCSPVPRVIPYAKPP